MENQLAQRSVRRLSLGRTEIWNNMRIALTGFTTPPLVMSNPHFLSDGVRNVYLSEEAQEKAKRLIYSSEQNALLMNYSFPRSLCEVSPGRK
jgi:hypothetical protein